jgi:hypothetical protein
MLLLYEFLVSLWFDQYYEISFYSVLNPILLSSNYDHICNFINRSGNNDKLSFNFIWQARKISLQTPKLLLTSNLPILVVRSTHDVLSNIEKDINLFVKGKPNNITFFKCEGYHSLLNEQNSVQLFEYIVNWIIK